MREVPRRQPSAATGDSYRLEGIDHRFTKMRSIVIAEVTLGWNSLQWRLLPSQTFSSLRNKANVVVKMDSREFLTQGLEICAASIENFNKKWKIWSRSSLNVRTTSSLKSKSTVPWLPGNFSEHIAERKRVWFFAKQLRELQLLTPQAENFFFFLWCRLPCNTSISESFRSSGQAPQSGSHIYLLFCQKTFMKGHSSIY